MKTSYFQDIPAPSHPADPIAEPPADPHAEPPSTQRRANSELWTEPRHRGWSSSTRPKITASRAKAGQFPSYSLAGADGRSIAATHGKAVLALARCCLAGCCRQDTVCPDSIFNTAGKTYPYHRGWGWKPRVPQQHRSRTSVPTGFEVRRVRVTPVSPYLPE